MTTTAPDNLTVAQIRSSLHRRIEHAVDKEVAPAREWAAISENSSRPLEGEASTLYKRYLSAGNLVRNRKGTIDTFDHIVKFAAETATAGDAHDRHLLGAAIGAPPDGKVLREPLTQAQIRDRRDKDNIVEALVAIDFDSFVGESLDDRLDMVSEALVDSPLLMDIHQTVLRYEPETGALIMRISGDVSEVLDDDKQDANA